MSLAHIACLTLVIALVSCGNTDPKALTDEGTAALGSGDAATAIKSFDAALQNLTPQSPDYLRARMGKCQALARKDPPAAKVEFLALCKAEPGRLREQDFSTVVSELLKHDAVVEAAEVMDAGVKMFPESPKMQVVKELVIDASKKAKSSEGMDKLKGLGYVGTDDQ
jgi:hypothetical protein